MKTKIVIDLETKNMKKIVPEEYIGKADECPEDEVMTEEIEAGIHALFSRIIHEIIEDDEINFTEKVMENEELSVEGFDSLSDYGDIKISITEYEEDKDGTG